MSIIQPLVRVPDRITSATTLQTYYNYFNDICQHYFDDIIIFFFCKNGVTKLCLPFSDIPWYNYIAIESGEYVEDGLVIAFRMEGGTANEHDRSSYAFVSCICGIVLSRQSPQVDNTF